MKEQIKQEMMNYLEKASKHLYVINGQEHKVLYTDNFYISITGNKVRVNSIDKLIDRYGKNSKCVMKHSLFLNNRYISYNNFANVESIPYYKAARKKYGDIMELIKDEKDSIKVLTIVNNQLNK